MMFELRLMWGGHLNDLLQCALPLCCVNNVICAEFV